MGGVSIDPVAVSGARVHTVCDYRFWLPCPRIFPAGSDRESWAAEMAAGWWHISDLPDEQNMVDRLAAMLRESHEEAYATVPCQQIWIYVRDPVVPPIPLHIGIWKTNGDREEQLLSLSGARDPHAVRPPLVAQAELGPLGRGIRAIRYVSADGDGSLCALLGYGFRVAELETDIQLLATSMDPAALITAVPDIEDFIRGMTVSRKEKAWT